MWCPSVCPVSATGRSYQVIPQVMWCPSVCPVSATLLPEARAVGGMRYPSVCPVSATEGATDGVEIEDAESLGLSGERNSE